MTTTRALLTFLLALLPLTVSTTARAQYFLISNHNTHSVMKYDTGTGRYSTFIPTNLGGLSGPHGIVVNPGNRNVFVSSHAQNTVNEYRADGTFIRAIGGAGLNGPEGLTAYSGFVYVSSYHTGEVLRINPSTGSIQPFAIVPGGRPRGICFAGGRLYVAGEADRTVYVFQPTGALIGGFVSSVNGLSTPWGVTPSADGQHLLVADHGNNRVMKVRLSDAAPQADFIVPGNGLAAPQAIGYGPDGNFYVTSLNTASVLSYSGTNGSFNGTFVSGNGLDSCNYFAFLNERPSVSGTVPSAIAPGGPEFTLQVNGTGFAPYSKVQWNGQDRATAYVSSTQLSATILAADIAAEGYAGVRVRTPDPDGAWSNEREFLISSSLPRYRIEEVGLYPGWLSNGFGINASGQITGHAWPAGSQPRAFRFSPPAASTDLGTMGRQSATGFSINSAGTVAGYVTGDGLPSRAVYSSQNSLLAVPGLPSDRPSEAHGINDSNQVVGVANRSDGTPFGFLAFLNGGGLVDISPEPGAYSFAESVNNYGQVTGANGSQGQMATAYLWTPDSPNGTSGTRITLTGLAEDRSSHGYAINDLGQVAGVARDASDRQQATLWDGLNPVQGLSVPGADPYAWAINNNTQIVGHYMDVGGSRAFIWDYVSGGLDLGSLIEPRDSGWRLSSARGINDNGQIVGYGTNPAGEQKAFILIPFSVQRILSLELSPAYEVTGGTITITGTVRLAEPAGAGGVDVALQCDSAAVTIPANLHIPAGEFQAQFTISTVPVNLDEVCTITAVYGSSAQSAVLTVLAPVPTTVTAVPASIVGGVAPHPTATVRISGPAPSGYTLSLTRSEASATVPSSVPIAEGATEATFTITTTPVRNPVAVDITATDAQGTSAAGTLQVLPPSVAAVTFSTDPIRVGYSSGGTVTISGPAPAGGWNMLLSSSGAATVPNSLTIPEGETQATFNAFGSAPGIATVTATDERGSSQSGTLTVLDYALTSLTLNPTAVFGTGSSRGTLTLDFPAASGGIVVNLSSNNSAASLPATMTVQAGQTSGIFTVNTEAVPVDTSVMITAVRGITPPASAGLLVRAPQLTGATLNPTVVISGQTTLLTVRITSPAPAGGSVVALSVPNSYKKLVPLPATVTIPAGATSAGITIQAGRANRTERVTITAVPQSRVTGTSRTAVLTVDPAP